MTNKQPTPSPYVLNEEATAGNYEINAAVYDSRNEDQAEVFVVRRTGELKWLTFENRDGEDMIIPLGVSA